MTEERLNIGWIGTGVMGAAMCGHLLAAGHDIAVYSRTRKKADELVNNGARWCDHPAAVADCSTRIFTTLGSEAEVRQVYFSDNGIFSALKPGAIVIDMGTTAPSLSREIALHAAGQGAAAIDAPVSGGDIGARNASLSIMTGGDPDQVELLRPLFDILGSSQRYMGKAGSGQHTKLCNQMTVAGTMIGVCEALVYAESAGLDTEQMVAAIRPGAAACWTLDNLAPRIISGDDAPGFMVDHFIKDLGIALAEAGNLGLKLPGLALAHDLYIQTQSLGHGRNGTQALVHAIRQLGKK